MADVCVIGAGIAGLTAAHRLHRKEIEVDVLEATERPGGVIRTAQADGFLVECGPNSLRNSALLESLVDDLELAPERVWANDLANRRYIVRDGRPTPIPMSVGEFLTTDLLSTTAKLRLFAEPFITRGPASTDESLADFTRRRLGTEVLDYAVAPFVGGVYAGDPEQLSARHSFEQLVEWEREHGSLFWGALRSGTEADDEDDVPSGLFSFRDGLETLPTALAEALAPRVQYQRPVERIESTDAGWTVHTEDEELNSSYEAVICTAPLPRQHRIALDTEVDRHPLTTVPYPPVHVVALGYEAAAVDHPLDGFGVLVPPVETDFDVLGTLFSSTLFPGRAPDGYVLLTTFVGGARAPSLARQDDATIQAVVERDLTQLLGVQEDPVFSRHVHWPNAIPQYTQGYGSVKDTLNALEQAHPGLFFAGNYRQGVSVGDAAASGAAAATRATERKADI